MFMASLSSDTSHKMDGYFSKGYNYPDYEDQDNVRDGQRDEIDVMHDFPNELKPRIVITGLRRSGKSSIQKVVFHKMSPNETLFLESTNKIVNDDIQNNSFIQFTVWDCPGQFNHDEKDNSDFENILRGCGALVYVIDSQDDYGDALAHLNQLIRRAHQCNSSINIEVFIHKVDGLSDDHKIEARSEILQKTTDDLIETHFADVTPSFYLTSIYDHSIFEAFSKVVQKLIPQMPILENLLNAFILNSGIEKAFLFDVVSKIFIATDSSPVDMQSYELCCDMIDVVMDISGIYGSVDNDGNSFDNQSLSTIRLNSGTVLYLREINKYLALVCILREDNFVKQGLIDYNFHCFRRLIREVFQHQINEFRLLNNNSLIPLETPFGSQSAHDGTTNIDLIDSHHHHHHHHTDSDLNSLDIDRTSTPIMSSSNQATNYKQINSTHPQQPQHYRKIAIVPSNPIATSLPKSQPTLAINQNHNRNLHLHPETIPSTKLKQLNSSNIFSSNNSTYGMMSNNNNNDSFNSLGNMTVLGGPPPFTK